MATCLWILATEAQKVAEKHMPCTAGKLIVMNFQISDSIRIITWNKAEVYIRSTIDIDSNKDNEAYKLRYEEIGDNISINGKLETDGENGCGHNWHNNRNCNCCCSCQSQITHEIYIPEGADISVETINGNIVLSGNIAGIRAHTISGYIDLALSPVRKADMKMSTISGTLYSNFEFPNSAGHLRHVGGNALDTQLNGGGGKPIELETISGNIFLRKAAS